jgi:hypothetical protein
MALHGVVGQQRFAGVGYVRARTLLDLRTSIFEIYEARLSTK